MAQKVINISVSEVLADALHMSAERADARTCYQLAALAFRQIKVAFPPPTEQGENADAGRMLALVEAEQERFLARIQARRQYQNEKNEDRTAQESNKNLDRTAQESNKNGVAPHTQTRTNNSSTGVDEEGAQGAQFALEADGSKPKKPKRPRAATFIPPTADEVREYAEAEGLAVDAAKFVNHYAANGWMRGRNRLKDWKAAVRYWASNNFDGRAGWNHERAAVTQLGSGGGGHGDY